MPTASMHASGPRPACQLLETLEHILLFITPPAVEILHELRQMLEVAPEAVDLISAAGRS
jgi:hypothetical protein